MNVEIGAEAALFPEKEYRNGIAVAVCIPVTLRDITVIIFLIFVAGLKIFFAFVIIIIVTCIRFFI
jgi:hypothetical protein